MLRHVPFYLHRMGCSLTNTHSSDIRTVRAENRDNMIDFLRRCNPYVLTN